MVTQYKIRDCVGDMPVLPVLLFDYTSWFARMMASLKGTAWYLKGNLIHLKAPL